MSPKNRVKIGVSLSLLVAVALGYNNCSKSPSGSAAPDSKTSLGDCKLTIPAPGVVYNAAGGGSTNLVFTREGTAVGEMWWSIVSGPITSGFSKMDLNTNGVSLPANYLNVPAGVYTTISEVRSSAGTVSCGATLITVAAPQYIPGTCSLTPSNGGAVANAVGSSLPTTLTFTRAGTAVGEMWWSIISGPSTSGFSKMDLNANGVSTPANYLNVPAGTYITTSEVRASTGTVSCGTMVVTVTAPPKNCTLTVSNSGLVGNATGSLPTSLIFTRGGSATGELWWSVTSGPVLSGYSNSGINAVGASDPVPYLRVPGGTYAVTSEVRSSAGTVSCGSLNITVVNFIP